MHFKIEKRYGGQAGWVCKQYKDGKFHYVPQASWPGGLKPELTLDQARDVVRSINARERILSDEAKRIATKWRVRSDEEKNCAWLPEDIVSHFERVHLEPRREKVGYAKLCSMWKLAKKMIIAVNLDPQDWPDEPLPLYEWWKGQPHSADYVRRVFRLVNKYGRLYCRKRKLSFEPVALPPDEVMVEIAEAFTNRKKSKALLPDHLDDLKKKLKPNEFAWVCVAFAFGLRPEECDLLLTSAKPGERKAWWTEGKILVVDQPKLRKVPKDERYKRIPALTKAQKTALAIIAQGRMTRPTQKRMQTKFPEGVTLYGCRHGFTRLKELEGYELPVISKWLGHRSLSTTERYYRDHGIVAKPKRKKAA